MLPSPQTSHSDSEGATGRVDGQLENDASMSRQQFVTAAAGTCAAMMAGCLGTGGVGGVGGEVTGEMDGISVSEVNPKKTEQYDKDAMWGRRQSLTNCLRRRL